MNDHLFDSTNLAHVLERAEALRALAEGKPMDTLERNGEWHRSVLTDIEIMDQFAAGYRYRMARSPEYKPWSLADHPSGAVFVKWKSDSRAEYLIGNWDGSVCKLIGRGYVSYQCLLSEYVCVDGSLCGTEVRA